MFLFEADESDGSFLLTDPAIGVVTNVEVDHIDFYPGGEEELRLAFAEFCARSGAARRLRRRCRSSRGGPPGRRATRSGTARRPTPISG